MRALIYSGLFALGFALALVLGAAVEEKRDSHLPKPARARLNAPVTLKSAMLKNLKEEISTSSTSGEFNLIRSESLRSNPQLYMAISTELNSFALETMVTKFSDSDWVLWKDNLSSYGSDVSEARRWLNSIKVVNFELGRYLETSALLFTALYHASTMGKVFSVEEELYELSTEASTIFQAITPKAYSPRINLDIVVTSDPSFLLWLERLRSQFIVNYAKREPKQLETQLLLLASVKQEYITPDVISVYNGVLKFAREEISPKYRLELKEHFLQGGREIELMEVSEDFTSGFTLFYMKCFEDAIEGNAISKAKALALKFGEYFPQSPYIVEMQNRIADIEQEKLSKLKQIAQMESKSTLVDQSGKKIGFSDYLSGISDKSSLREFVERVGVGIILIMVLALIVVRSLPLFFLYINSRKVKRERLEEERQRKEADLDVGVSETNDNKGKMIPITKPLTSKISKYGRSNKKKLANL